MSSKSGSDRLKVYPIAFPAVAIILGGEAGEDGSLIGRAAFYVLLVGVAAGALWQRESRRDLTNRLSIFALGVLAGALLLAVEPSGRVVLNAGPAYAIAGIIAGLVLAEQAMRHLDSRRSLRGGSVYVDETRRA